MTYLDPAHTRNRNDWRSRTARIIAVGALLAFGWFVFTLGMERDGGTKIVSEPGSEAPAVQSTAPTAD